MSPHPRDIDSPPPIEPHPNDRKTPPPMEIHTNSPPPPIEPHPHDRLSSVDCIYDELNNDPIINTPQRRQSVFALAPPKERTSTIDQGTYEIPLE